MTYAQWPRVTPRPDVTTRPRLASLISLVGSLAVTFSAGTPRVAAGPDPQGLGEGVTFQERTAQAKLQIWEANDIGGWHGTYVGDYNNDGYDDLFMTSHGIGVEDDTGKNVLFHNNGDGTFREVASDLGLDGGWHGRYTRELHGASWFDFDHDGDLDLYMPNTDSAPGDGYHAYDEVYRNEGGVRFSNASQELGLPEVDWSRRGGLALDLENDGDLDLVFVNAADSDHNFVSPYENVYVLRNGAYRLEDRGMEFVKWSEGITSLDYDGDEDTDVLVANEEGGRLVLWENNGEGWFREVAQQRGLGSAEGLNGSVTAGDVDNDGDIDVYVARGLYRNEGGQFSFVEAIGGPHENMHFGDLDNDGDLDLVSGGVYWNDGSGSFRRDDKGLDPGQARGGIAFDQDNDGDLDLIFNVSDRSQPYLRFYRNDLSNGNHWLQITLRHTNGHAGCPAAKIRVYRPGTQTLVGYREVTTATGFVSGPSYRQHFGLGDLTTVDLEVWWPTGERRRMAGVRVDQAIEIAPEPGSSSPVLGIRGDQFTLNGQPTFLLGVSYFDGYHWHPSDLDQLAQRRFNLLRIWLDWSSKSFFDASGRLVDGAKLLELVRAAGARGMAVDVTILDTDLSFDRSHAEDAVRDVLRALRDEPNVFYDLVNEHTHPEGPFSHTELAALARAARQEDPDVILTVSSEGGHLVDDSGGRPVNDEDVDQANVRAEVLDVRVDVLSPHFNRTSDWHELTDERVAVLKSFLASIGEPIPIYLQEEARRGHSGLDPSQQEFFQAAREALQAGAASWVFHTDAAFELSGSTFFENLDSVERETVDGLGAVIFGGTTFADVPGSHWAYAYVESLYAGQYIAGCSSTPRLFCPQASMTRAEGAVFVVRGVHGGGFLPQEPTSEVFADVALGTWYAKWADALWRDGYTAGCGSEPLAFCPLQAHTRAEATVFFLRMLRGKDYLPAAPTEASYSDVPVGAAAPWYSKWVYAARGEGLTLPCEVEEQRGDTLFRPMDPLARAEGACMMAIAKGLAGQP